MTETDICIPQQATPDKERFTLRKSAKLRHRTLVRNLFEKGKSVYAGPLRIIYRMLTAEQLNNSFRGEVPDLIGPVQLMITVPKKKRRHAVDRVLMRRRIREAFRLQYHPLRRYVEENPDIRTLSIGIVYMDSSNFDMEEIRQSMRRALEKLMKRL